VKSFFITALRIGLALNIRTGLSVSAWGQSPVRIPEAKMLQLLVSTITNCKRNKPKSQRVRTQDVVHQLAPTSHEPGRSVRERRVSAKKMDIDIKLSVR